MRVRVSEWFVSVQGEGPAVGEPAFFLRLAGCNLACTWCDTPYTWDWSRFDRQEQTRSLDTRELSAEILTALPESVRLLVITGGEPLLQQRAIVEITTALRATRPQLRVEIETNGTVIPTQTTATHVTRFVVSPKLANAGHQNVGDPAKVAKFARLNSVLKFVVECPDDVVRAVDFAVEAGFAPSRVWVMPEGVDADTVVGTTRAITPAAIAHGVSVGLRLHVVVWGDERGR